MNIGYTVVERFFPLDDFKNETGFKHINEVITLDHQICSSCIKSYNSQDEPYIFRMDEFLDYDIYNNLSILLNKIDVFDNKQCLALIREPHEDCHHIHLEGFKFYGYDLIYEDSKSSLLNNCCGLFHDCVKAYVSEYGLIEDFKVAQEIKKVINESQMNMKCTIWGIYRLE